MATGGALCVGLAVGAGVGVAAGAAVGDGVGATAGEAVGAAVCAAEGEEVGVGAVAEGAADGAGVGAVGVVVTVVVVVEVSLAVPEPAVTTVAGTPDPVIVTPIWRSIEPRGMIVHVRVGVDRGALSGDAVGVAAATAVIAQAVGMLLM
ncbi:MAG TPA: hypothetical protein VFX65_00015 [Candidatus Limnocylindrales bacterium]|nr:hypothetical protein [Candidatus Limnocylindrales bacterium]